jgi:antitoxin (DNA-binding transcriptional repressor) of toxin-antitoxin stability system
MHEAKTHLSRLVADAVRGEPFIIARSGRPPVKEVAIEEPEATSPFGLLAGRATFPDDGAEFAECETAATFER